MRPLVRSPLLALALLPCLAGLAAAQERPTDPRAERVARGLLPPIRVEGISYAPATIEQRMRELRVPAVSVAVVDSGRIVWARAYGLRDVATGAPATTSTLFQAASISKPVAATAVLQLAQEGRIALDSAANRYLKSWKIPDNAFTAAAPVTVRHLLTHTGGLTVHGFPGYVRGTPVPTPVQVLDALPPTNTAAVRVDTTPGARWRYSGGGITVLQQLVADVRGADFATVMRERVLRPAGMLASTYEQPLPDARMAEAATAYRPSGEPYPGMHHVYPEQAAAGLWTTPSDLARWIIEVQRALAGEPGRVLTPEVARAMVTPGLGGWGLGVGIGASGDAQTFNHGGANAGFRAIMIGFVRGGRGVVVMTNSDAGNGLANEIVQAVAREHGFPGTWGRIIKPVAIDSAGRARLAGSYRNPAGLTMRIAIENEALVALMPSGARWELFPTAGDRLESPSGAMMEVERAGDGRAGAIRFSGMRWERLDPAP